MAQTKMFDPSIQALLAKTTEDWGDPVLNREKLIPYGIAPLDRSLYGFDGENGEVVVIQADQKNRKSTTVANIVPNYMTWEKLHEKPHTNFDILESGMRPEKQRDTLIAIMASRYLMSQGHSPIGRCKACGGTDTCHQLGIDTKFLKYNTRTKTQLEAITYAMDTMSSWKLTIHGASLGQGNTRDLASASKSLKNDKARWLYLIETYGMKVLIIDHIQQYQFSDDPTDYEKQIRVISTIAEFVSQYNIIGILLSQVSLGSLREARAGGKLVAAGGSKAAQEANTVLSVSYKPNSGVVKIHVEESRHSGTFSVWQRLDDVSGAFYGEASTVPFLDEPE